MKKEITAGILLVILSAAVLFNTGFSEKVFTELRDELSRVYELSLSGDTAQAQRLMEDAVSRWEALGVYTHVLIGHADVDAVNEAVFSFCGDVFGGDSSALRGSYGYVISCIDDMISTEGISLRSIF